jgi:hypothetical protein
LSSRMRWVLFTTANLLDMLEVEPPARAISAARAMIKDVRRQPQ